MALTIGIFISYWQLSNALKTQFNEAYLTHGQKLLYFVVWVEVSLLCYALLVIAPLFELNATAGIMQTVVQ